MEQSIDEKFMEDLYEQCASRQMEISLGAARTKIWLIYALLDKDLPGFRIHKIHDNEFREFITYNKNYTVTSVEYQKNGIPKIHMKLREGMKDTNPPNVIYQRERLFRTCKNFIDELGITCEEDIYQTDRVIQHALDFIEEVANIVGYYKETEND